MPTYSDLPQASEALASAALEITAPAFVQESAYASVIARTLEGMDAFANGPKKAESLIEQLLGEEYDVTTYSGFLDAKGVILDSNG